MAGSFKICPICNTPNHASATLCKMCGTSLSDVEAVTRVVRQKTPAPSDYDFRYGETDLLEAPLSRRGQTAFTIVAVALVAFVLGGAAFALGSNLLGSRENATPLTDSSSTPSSPVTFATVTLGPPTGTTTFTPAPTFTPSQTFTPEPCIQQIASGDSLLGVIGRCGHRDRDVLPTVVALNGLRDENSLQIGQNIVVPWPTPTTDPNALPTETLAVSNPSDVSVGMVALDESIDPFAPTATPTLPAGVMWHIVQPNENIVVIADQYHINAKILSELNPEVDFALCDFGQRFGGEECRVMLSIGQSMRVPAPTPTLTPLPTIDPNAPPTPTATPTYNEPNPISPPDRQFFGVDELITLRWVPTGTLSQDELYRVDVEDTTIGVQYTAYTRDITLVVPLDWRGREQARHEFTWKVGIVNQAARNTVRFQTAPRIFVWQGLVESESK